MSDASKIKPEMTLGNINSNPSITLNGITRQNLVNSSKSSTQVMFLFYLLLFLFWHE